MSAAAKEVQQAEEQLNWHWRNTMRVVRFFTFDARAAFPIPILIFHARLSTLVITIMTLLLFRFLEQKGLTVPAAAEKFQAVAGRG